MLLRRRGVRYWDLPGSLSGIFFRNESDVRPKEGKPLVIKEDVGRHNALDKVIGHSFKNSLFNTKNQFIACSGRLSFELVQKTLMANIGLLMGVGAPTSLAIDLAKRFDMTLIGFVKSNSFNIYCGENRILK